MIQTALNYARYNPGTDLLFLEGIYDIDTRLWGYGSTKIHGELSVDGSLLAKLRLKNECGWTNQLSDTAMIVFSAQDDIEIYSLDFDGNSANQSYVSEDPWNYPVWWGHGFHQGIYLPRSTHINIHDCYFHNSLGDGVRGGAQTSYLNFYNNKCDTLGHVCLFMDGGPAGGHDVAAWGNNMTMRADGALRADDTWNVHFYNNIITSSSSGNPGIQIGDHYGMCANIEIDHNTITRTPGPGIWMNDLSTSDMDKGVYIHDNIISECGLHAGITYNCGILINRFNGTLIENNQILDCYNAGILCYNPYGTAGYNTITLQKNIITGTVETTATNPTYIKEWTGYAVVNALSDTTTVYEMANTLENNINGEWFGTINHITLPEDPEEPEEPEDPYIPPADPGDWGILLPSRGGQYRYVLYSVKIPPLGAKALVYPAHSGQYYLLRLAENASAGDELIIINDTKGNQYLIST